MISPRHVELFEKQGFFTLPQAFGSEEIEKLTRHVEPFVRQHQEQLAAEAADGVSRANEISFTMHLAQKDGAILDCLMRSVLPEVGQTLLGQTAELYWDQAVYKRPETRKEFPWHQDNGYTPVDPAQYVTCWIALETAVVENGCIWVLPGSHHLGEQTHEQTKLGWQGYFGDDPGVPVELPKGGMAVFSSLLLHRSGPNVSARERKGYIVQLTPPGARRRDTGQAITGPALRAP